MRILLSALVLLLSTGANIPYPNVGPDLPRSTPESQGISSSAILKFIETADREIDTMNSFMLVRNGQVVAEAWWSPYAAELPHVLYSLSKSFTSTAVGFAVAEGLVSIDDRVIDFFPEDAPPEPSHNLREMRVHDLLRMNTGHDSEADLRASAEPWTKTFLSHPVPFKPGSRFLYNTPATYMLSAIVQKVSGETVLDYLRPRLFEPLGIDKPIWGTSPEGITIGGYGLSVRTEDIAKLGQLYLQDGEWNGEQLLPAEWTKAATSLQTSNGSNPNSDWDQGYGYQFWRSRFGNYRGDGAFGQYCIVMPEHNAVVAITSGVRDMQAVMNLVWNILQPAMGSSPLSADAGAHEDLIDRMANLRVRTVSGDASSPIAESVSGRSYMFDENGKGLESVRLDLTTEPAILHVRARGVDDRIVVGEGSWETGQSTFVNGVGDWLETGAFAVAATGAWTADDTYTVKLVLQETPFYTTMNFRFDGDEVTLSSEHNASFGPTTQPELKGLSE